MASEIAYVLIVTGLFYVLARALHFIIERYIKGITKRTRTDLDDLIVKSVEKPFDLAVLLVGFNFALVTAGFTAGYRDAVADAFFVAYVFVVALAIAGIFRVLTYKWLNIRKKQQNTPYLLNRLVSIIVYIVGMLIVLSRFNIDVTPLVATLGIGGIALGLALQSTLSNFFAGLSLVSDKYVNVGDFVEIGDVSGWIMDVGSRSTRIKTLGNDVCIIPNSKFAESIIKNTYEPVQPVTVNVECGVAYGSDLDKVQRVVEKTGVELIKRFPEVDPGLNPPLVFFKEFGASNINFVTYIKARDASVKAKVKHEYIKAIDRAFKKEKIEISWPVMNVHMRR